MVYCKRIPINGSSAKDGTNYVMTLTIPYVADKMRADFADIRFTNDLGINYTYTLVSKTDSSTATFDIKIPSIPQSTTSYLKAWSNTGYTTTASDPENTYMLYDNFSGAVGSAPDTNKWTVTKSGSVNAGASLDGSGNLILRGDPNTTGTTAAAVRSVQNFPSYELDARIFCDDSYRGGDSIGFGQGTPRISAGGTVLCLDNGYSFYGAAFSAGAVDITIAKTDGNGNYTGLSSYHYCYLGPGEKRFTVDQNGTMTYYYSDDTHATQSTQVTNTDNTSNTPFYFWMGGSRWRNVIYYEHIKTVSSVTIRPFITPQPTFGTIPSSWDETIVPDSTIGSESFGRPILTVEFAGTSNNDFEV